MALSEVKTLSGMLPICASCKKIRDDKGYWKQIESYIKEHAQVDFSYGLCPECALTLCLEYEISKKKIDITYSYIRIYIIALSQTTLRWCGTARTSPPAAQRSREKMKIEYAPIGIIHSPFLEPEGMPIQPTGGAGIKGTVEVFEAFQPGLKDLDGFSHIILLYHFHRSHSYTLEVLPFLDSETRGLFATRAPKRPNPIGLSVVQLDNVEDGVLHIRNVDILDGTPLLDIKPYVPDFDAQRDVRTGWLEKAGKTVSSRKSDDRFK